ncbi:MAG: glutamyl-tRNA reductase [Candidatus Kapabacteria bacterium]|nr:glutamyl-tRNA reductase [Candidatus Kapabacteria bacterium]
MNLYIFGINQKTSLTHEREVFQLNRKEIPKALKTIKEYDGVEAVLILNTCNRVEFYLLLADNITPEEIIRKYYFEEKQIIFEGREHLFISLANEKATEHLFRVISGLESLVLGEYQIQGQVKEAYSIACEVKTLEKIMHKLFHAAFRCGKAVRNNTSLGEGKQSVSGVASKIIIDKLNKTDKIAIIGVNENTKIMASELKANNFYNLIFVNRTLYKAEILAEEYGGIASPLSNIENILTECKAIFSSTGSPDYIVTNEILQRLIAQGKCPNLIIDMAIPRDIETRNLPEEIEVYDLGRLNGYLERQNLERMKDFPKAEKIIEDEVRLFQTWADNSDNELLQPIAEKIELVRQNLINEYENQFSDQSKAKVDKITRQLIHRIQPILINALLKAKE